MSNDETVPEKKKKPANVAPDAVMDPNEKTDGMPGKGPSGGKTEAGETQADETDPGSG